MSLRYVRGVVNESPFNSATEIYELFDDVSSNSLRRPHLLAMIDMLDSARIAGLEGIATQQRKWMASHLHQIVLYEDAGLAAALYVNGTGQSGRGDVTLLGCAVHGTAWTEAELAVFAEAMFDRNRLGEQYDWN